MLHFAGISFLKFVETATIVTTHSSPCKTSVVCQHLKHGKEKLGKLAQSPCDLITPQIMLVQHNMMSYHSEIFLECCMKSRMECISLKKPLKLIC